jgi:hypothetical protein
MHQILGPRRSSEFDSGQSINPSSAISEPAQLFNRVSALTPSKGDSRVLETERGFFSLARSQDGSVTVIGTPGSAIVTEDRIEIRSAFSNDLVAIVDAIECSSLVSGFLAAFANRASSPRALALVEGDWSFDLSRTPQGDFLVIGHSPAVPKFWAVVDPRGKLLEGDPTGYRVFRAEVAAAFGV